MILHCTHLQHGNDIRVTTFLVAFMTSLETGKNSSNGKGCDSLSLRNSLNVVMECFID